MIIDKYERAKGVVNQDVLDVPAERRLDYVIAISTLEHVGWDEHPMEPSKAVTALDHLRSCLHRDGTMLLTVPLGYHGALDAAVLTSDTRCAETYVLDRTWRWRCRPVGPADLGYQHELRSVRAVWIGELPATIADRPLANEQQVGRAGACVAIAEQRDVGRSDVPDDRARGTEVHDHVVVAADRRLEVLEAARGRQLVGPVLDDGGDARGRDGAGAGQHVSVMALGVDPQQPHSRHVDRSSRHEIVEANDSHRSTDIARLNPRIARVGGVPIDADRGRVRRRRRRPGTRLGRPGR